MFPLGKVLRQVLTVTTREDSLDSWERAETLEVAHRAGIDRVRGHVWTAVALTESQRESFADHVCSRKDLCYTCGWAGHMASSCSAGGARARWMVDGVCSSGGSAADAAGASSVSREASLATGVSVVASRWGGMDGCRVLHTLLTSYLLSLPSFRFGVFGLGTAR